MPFETANTGLPSFIPVCSQVFGNWRLSVERRPFDQVELARQYDRLASRWQRIIDRHQFQDAYKTLFDRVMYQPHFAQTANNLRVLDVGIGTGAMALALRQHLGKGFRLEGVDISSAMLREADARLRDTDIDANLKKAALGSLPYAANTFDVVLAAHVIEHLPDPRAALRDAIRVLKPGGILLCCITRQSRTGVYIQFMWRTHCVREAKAVSWLHESGFGTVRSVSLDAKTGSHRFSCGYVGLKPMANRLA